MPTPLLIQNSRRLKKTGAPSWARRMQTNQNKRYAKVSPADPQIAAFLGALYDKEQTTAKPWREIAEKPARPPESLPESPAPPAGAAAQA